MIRSTSSFFIFIIGKREAGAALQESSNGRNQLVSLSA